MRHAVRQMHLYLHLGSRIVVYTLSFDLAFVYRFENTVDKRRRGLAERYLADNERPVVELLYLRPHLQSAAPLPVIILADINGATRGKVGIKRERLAAQILDGRIANLIEVMRQQLAAQPNGNTLGPLRQEQRELHRQRNRFLVPSVITQLPVGSLRIENHVEGKLRQPCLNITRSSRTVARQDVSPVALTVNEQVLLPHLHQGIADRSVAMRVELHRVAHDIGHLIITSVVHALHRMQDAPLHGLQSVFDMRHGPFQNHIAGIVQEPVLVHAAQVMYGRSVEPVGRSVVRMGIFAQHFLFVDILAVFEFFVHVMLI